MICVLTQQELNKTEAIQFLCSATKISTLQKKGNGSNVKSHRKIRKIPYHTMIIGHTLAYPHYIVMYPVLLTVLI
jgi:hypothetical protein